ncbi:MAG: M48 family metallopeptidase [Lachnospiraceae bacterium]|nr:M48 family metallopeptidase [Lachnospiraceae bacterium]
MGIIKQTLNTVKGFVYEFINSESHHDAFHQSRENATAWYAEWDDNYMGDFIGNPITRQFLRTVTDHYYADQLDEILLQSKELTKTSYPSFYIVYLGCCEKLGLYKRPKAYITSRLQGINALSIEVKDKRMILISRRVVISLTVKEQAFILGHELGHHQQGNLVCHTLNGLLDNLNNKTEIIGPIIADAVEVPLKRWCRCSEFNADRAGIICCGDIEVVKGLFQKLGMCQQMSAYSEYSEIGSSHPHFQTRLSALAKYTTVQKLSEL